MVSAKWVVLWSLWLARLAREPTAPLRVRGGLLRGALARDGSHAAYLGISYATLTDENRFQAPGPEPTWEGVFEAVEENVRCLQRVELTRNIFMGQHDCLRLNVYTPLNVEPGADLPVMVYIHGGAFIEGSGSPVIFGPRQLVSKGVIVVSLNYRLYLQGFLCLRTKEAPGNAGLKDQVAALRWVQRNIRVFGGDPDNVTIFGESAGSASVSHHLLSPMSKGLFHRAIMQSGSSLAGWAHQYSPIEAAAALARLFGHDTKDPKELYKIFSNLTDLELYRPRIPRDLGGTILSEIVIAPCVEEVIDGVEPFLTESPYKLLKKGAFARVPIIIGTNNEEGYYLTSYENKTTLKNMDLSKALPTNLWFESDEDRSVLGCSVREMYMGNDTISKESILKLSKFYGEPFFEYPAIAETELILEKSDQPVFNYMFNYDGWRNIAKIHGKYWGVPGATHGDELFYLFEQYIIPNLFEGRMMNKITTLWTNFAKYGNPTPEVTRLIPVRWQPANISYPEAFVIDQEFSSMPLWYKPSLEFWHNIYTKYRRS